MEKSPKRKIPERKPSEIVFELDDGVYTFKHKDIMGDVVIGTADFEKTGIPEIEYDSFKEEGVGSGDISDWMKAIWLLKESVKVFRKETGWDSDIVYKADNRDGEGLRRKKMFERYIPEIKCIGLHEESE